MVHHLFNPEVDLTSDTTATAVFRFESHHWLPDGEPVHYMHNFGSYHETFVRLEDGRWYIRTLELTRLRVECRLWKGLGPEILQPLPVSDGRILVAGSYSCRVAFNCTNVGASCARYATGW